MNGCAVYMVCVNIKLCFFMVIFELVICDFNISNSFSNADISLHNIQCFKIVFISKKNFIHKINPKYMGGERRKCRWGRYGGGKKTVACRCNVGENPEYGCIYGLKRCSCPFYVFLGSAVLGSNIEI